MINLSNYNINLHAHAYGIEPTENAYANGTVTLYSFNKPLSGLNTKLKPLNFQPNQSKVQKNKVQFLSQIKPNSVAVKKATGFGLRSIVKSKPLLCWHEDIGFLNLRHMFLNLLQAIHLVWKIAKNNGRVMLINSPFDQKANLSKVENLIKCQLRPTLRRQNFLYSSSFYFLKTLGSKANTKTFQFANPSIAFTKLTQLTKFNVIAGLGVGIDKRQVNSLHRVRLWIKLNQLTSRLVTCSYGAVKMGWFSNRAASNNVWNPLRQYDQYRVRCDTLLKQLSKSTFKSKQQNSIVLPMGYKRANGKKDPWSRSGKRHQNQALKNRWFSHMSIPYKKGPLTPSPWKGRDQNKSFPKGTELEVLDFCSSITDNIAAKSYLQRFYNTVKPNKNRHIVSLISTNAYDGLSTGRKSTYDQQLAKNLLLGQINAVVFSHPENSVKLVQQARNLNIPTIGLCGGFAQKNAKPNKYRQWVDYPIICNPNKDNVTMLFSKITKASIVLENKTKPNA